jgi:hypothetical protein
MINVLFILVLLFNRTNTVVRSDADVGSWAARAPRPKVKNAAAPAVQREAEEDWGR